MKKEIKIKRLPNEQTIIKVNGEIYKQVSFSRGVETYQTIDKKEYEEEIRKLATDLVKISDLDLIAVVESALKAYALEDIKAVRQTLDDELAKAKEEGEKPKVRKEPGCMGIRIGNGHKVGSFVQIVS